MPGFHGGELPFRGNLIADLSYFWTKTGKEMFVTRNTDHMEINQNLQ